MKSLNTYGKQIHDDSGNSGITPKMSPIFWIRDDEMLESQSQI